MAFCMSMSHLSSRAGLLRNHYQSETPSLAVRPCTALRRCRRQVVHATQAENEEAARLTPWGFGFQMNERYLQWDDAAAAQLIKLHISHKLKLTVDEVEQRLAELGTLVPDMVNKLPRMRADILLQLVKDPTATTHQLMGLKDLLPNTNISSLVTRWPFILLDFTLESLEDRLQQMRVQLPGVRVEALVDLEPQMLKVDIPQVLANIKRLMPNNDPIDILVSQPQMVLDMQQAGLSSALDVEGIPTTSRFG